MGNRASAVTLAVLKWARERAGYSADQVAARRKKPVAMVLAWEDGTDAPTFRQLEVLATTLYTRPVALFFFPEPPDEPEPQATAWWKLAVDAWPDYANYQAKTDRQIPVFVLEPMA
jgi:transcriptional regulator with XRE-family HTH domain